MAPRTTWEEKNTGSNLPAQRELYSDTAEGHENAYKFLIMAKGGGSANKSFLYQETKAILNPERMLAFLDEKLRALGTSACPPYHLAIVVGGMSAEYTLKVAKLASARYLDTLPGEGSGLGSSSVGGTTVRAMRAELSPSPPRVTSSYAWSRCVPGSR